MLSNIFNLISKDEFSLSLGPYSFSYNYNHNYFCPEIKRTKTIFNQMQSFVNMENSINKVNTLPNDLLNKLSIAAIERFGDVYKVVQNKNFLVVPNDLPIINYLNLMIEKRVACFESFPDGIPILILLRDEIHTSLIDSFVEETEYLYGSCQNTACSTNEIYEIIYNAPIFLFSKHVVEKSHPTFGNYYLESNKPLLVDPYTIIPSFSDNEKTIAREDRAWEEKETKIYWRGQNGESTYDKHDCIEDAYNGKYPRLGLILEGIKNPDYINMRFAQTYKESWISNKDCIDKVMDHIGSIDSDVIHKLFIDNPSDKEEHLKYKYLVSVDGWTSAWGRVPWILSSNSVLVKQKSTTEQWFYSEMEKDEHYIEVSENFKEEYWANLSFLDDNKMKEVSQNGQKLYFDLFSESNIDNVIFTTIHDYYDAYLSESHMNNHNQELLLGQNIHDIVHEDL